MSNDFVRYAFISIIQSLVSGDCTSTDVFAVLSINVKVVEWLQGFGIMFSE